MDDALDFFVALGLEEACEMLNDEYLSAERSRGQLMLEVVMIDD